MSTISFSGLASGIDSDSVISALLDARRLVAEPLEAKTEFNKKESAAFEELNTKLLTLQDSLKGFMTVTGGAASKAVSSSNENAVTAVASSSALQGTTSINVSSLASPAMVSFNDRFSSLDEAIAKDLTDTANITIKVGSGETVEEITVSIDNKTTLRELARKINDASSGNIQASYVNAGDSQNPEHIFLINGLVSGEKQGALEVLVDSQISSSGIFADMTISQAKDAVLDVSGIGTVRRSSNQIGDLIPGVTIDLKQENTGVINLTVNTDTEKTAAKVSSFVEAINAVIVYSNDNDKIERVENSDGVTNNYGSLAKTRVDDQVVEAIKRALSDVRSNVSNSSVSIFADIGVTTQRDGTLKFDSALFSEALNSDPQAVGQLLNKFSDKVATTAGIIAEWTKYQGTIDKAISSNDEENQNINDRISRLDENLEKQRQMMVKIFTNLESTISSLNSNASALTSLITGGVSSSKK